MLRPAVPHLGGEKTPVSSHILTDDTVSISDENTGSFQVKSNSNSVPNFLLPNQAEIGRKSSQFSVTGSVTTYKEKQKHVGVSENNTEDQPKP